jgi:hypothetical protein
VRKATTGCRVATDIKNRDIAVIAVAAENRNQNRSVGVSFVILSENLFAPELLPLPDREAVTATVASGSCLVQHFGQ